MEVLLEAWESFALVERDRLSARAPEVLHHRVTTVIAPAGYGKSNLLRTWADTVASAPVNLTSADQSLATVGHKVVDALRLRVPGLQDTFNVEPATGPGGGTGTDRVEALAAFIADGLQRHLTRPLVLMFEDIDSLGDSEGAAFVDALIRQAPADISLVLSARSAPSVRLARLRAQGRVLDIGAEELAFTTSETAGLADLLGLAPEQAVDVHELTGGWPVATRMALEAVRKTGEVPTDASRRAGLFDYLAEEVFGGESEDDQLILAELCELGTFAPELALAARVSADQSQLDRLHDRGVYLEVRAGQWSVLPLVRAFLASRSLVPEDRRQYLHARAAGWYLDRRRPEDALRYAISAGNPDVTRSVLMDVGSLLVGSGAAAMVISAIESLNGDDLSMQRLLGEAQLYVGLWPEALVTLGSLAAEQEHVDAGLAWRMLFMYYQRGDLDEARQLFERARPPSGPQVDQALLLGWAAAVFWVLGDADECRKLCSEAVEHAVQSADDRALAGAYTVQAMLAALDGDRHANEALYLQALHHAERGGDLLQMLRIHVNRGSRHMEEGAYLEAIAETEVALQIADLGGFRSFRAMGMTNRGEARTKVARFDEAASDFAEAQAIWEGLNSRQVSYALMSMADVHLVRGDITLARAGYEEARSIAASVHDTQGLVPALAGLSRVTALDDPATAVELAQEAVAIGPTLGKVDALLALAGAHLANADPEAAAGVATEALQLSQQRRDRAGMAEALELAAVAEQDGWERLNEALRIWEELGAPLGQLRTRLRRLAAHGAQRDELEAVRSEARLLGARPLAAQASAMLDSLDERERPKLQINSLGGFLLSRDDAVVGPADWQSKKARDLLKILVARRGRPIAREALQDHLWPDDDPAKTANRLSVALSTLRGVLDPDKEFESDHYLFADRESVTLRLDTAAVDLELFHADAADGFVRMRSGDTEAGLRNLTRAEARFTGDVFDEDPYEPWAAAVREEARTVYVDVARALADAAIAKQEWDGAIRYLLRILERDHYDERAHLALVEAMIGARRHGEARRLYGQYCGRMAELDVEPAAFPQAVTIA